ncbi:hypothetical protein HU200_005862 [Digitaria exilis]|uniref:Uncharacterized protein n=1 Tax=Digitaria exilis TaxID=1010633 RepID=A0A835FR24_9POAL|nr:hypothetical protein HU200_005862 [Digitaria exilis]
MSELHASTPTTHPYRLHHHHQIILPPLCLYLKAQAASSQTDPPPLARATALEIPTTHRHYATSVSSSAMDDEGVGPLVGTCDECREVKLRAPTASFPARGEEVEQRKRMMGALKVQSNGDGGEGLFTDDPGYVEGMLLFFFLLVIIVFPSSSPQSSSIS